MHKNILTVVGISILFLGVAGTPMTLGYDVRIKDESQVTIFEEPPEFEWTRKYGFTHSY